MIILGIESTAHTFGIGIMDNEKILANAKDMYIAEKGGIHPLEAANHHNRVKDDVLKKALDDAKIRLEDVEVFAYSAGPGLPPCLRVGTEFVKKISKGKSVIEINHCIAHVEIGKMAAGCKDPITLYVSGGNTQIIGYAESRYRVFGETQDMAVGNAIDVFIRDTLKRGHFGGPVMEELAKKGKYTELPYVVKGMDLSFTGILTAAKQKFAKGEKIEDLCYSFQETCYAMLTEVTERALAHTEKKEVLLTGGVAASKRLQEMIKKMAEERDAKFFVVPRDLAGDNAAMIAWNGLIAYKSGQKPARKIDFNPRWRTDEVDILWI